MAALCRNAATHLADCSRLAFLSTLNSNLSTFIMPYALIQQVPVPPPLEKLQRAFRAVRCLTPADAHSVGRDGFGILVKHFSAEDAARLQSALHAEGIETEIVEQQLLPELPPVKFMNRMDCLPEALMLYDPLGRSFPLEWKNIMAIAAGSVRLSEFQRVQESRAKFQFNSHGIPSAVTIFDVSRREQLNFHLLLEIILTRAVQRYSVTADRFNFAYLGERRTKSLPANFTLLVRDLIQFAPQARLNHGAQLLRDNTAEVWSYPSKNAFTEEIIWMLWQMKKG